MTDQHRAFDVASLAERWRCSPAKVAWLIKRGHLPAFVTATKRPRLASYRVLAEHADKGHLVALAPEIAPPKPEPVLSPLARRMRDTLRAFPRDGQSVYFGRTTDFVKIGHSLTPAERVKSLDREQPHGMTLLKSVRASFAAEQALHDLLAPFHHRFELFRLEPELAEAIMQLPGKGPKT
jgi:Meiotically up-regulated gene 113